MSPASGKTNYHVGDSFQVVVNLDAGANSVNTISGKISVPTDYFDISSLRYGTSIVTLWVEKPAVDSSAGQITFTGGIPGGFNSRTGQVLSFVLKAKKVGTATLSLSDAKVLLNDGQGTELKNLNLPPLSVSISKALTAPTPGKISPEPQVYTPPVDNTPPEAFIPLVSRHPSIGDNSYFVSFSAVDKDSGIAYYQVKETPWLLPFGAEDWVRADSPYILKYQLWPTEVTVRAFDQQGNHTDGDSWKPIDPAFAVGIFALLVLLAYICRSLSTKKPIKPKSKMVKYKE